MRKYMPKKDESLLGEKELQDPYQIWPRDNFVPIRDGEIITTEVLL